MVELTSMNLVHLPIDIFVHLLSLMSDYDLAKLVLLRQVCTAINKLFYAFCDSIYNRSLMMRQIDENLPYDKTETISTFRGTLLKYLYNDSYHMLTHIREIIDDAPLQSQKQFIRILLSVVNAHIALDQIPFPIICWIHNACQKYVTNDNVPKVYSAYWHIMNDITEISNIKQLMINIDSRIMCQYYRCIDDAILTRANVVVVINTMIYSYMVGANDFVNRVYVTHEESNIHLGLLLLSGYISMRAECIDEISDYLRTSDDPIMKIIMTSNKEFIEKNCTSLHHLKIMILKSRNL